MTAGEHSVLADREKLRQTAGDVRLETRAGLVHAHAVHRSGLLVATLLSISFFLGGCAGPRSYSYRHVPGKTATLAGGYAIPPAAAPEAVHAAVAAANRIAGSAYDYGGGHGRSGDTGFDCSGATSYVLRSAGLLRGSMPSTGFRRYGSAGEGEWISVWARRGHVFLVIAGLRFDTGYTGERKGARWTTRSRPARGYVIRHPPGL